MKRCILFLVLALLVVGCSKSKRRSVSSGYTGENSAALSPEMLLPEEITGGKMTINANDCTFHAILTNAQYNGSEWEVTYHGCVKGSYKGTFGDETLNESVSGTLTTSPITGGLILRSKEEGNKMGLQWGDVTILFTEIDEDQRTCVILSGNIILYKSPDPFSEPMSYILSPQFKGATITLNKFWE